MRRMSKASYRGMVRKCITGSALVALLLISIVGYAYSESAHETLLAKSFNYVSATAQLAQSIPAFSDPLLMQATRQAAPLGSLTMLMSSSEWNLGFVLITLAIAACLGALHALTPGHGKLVIASYMAGSNRSAKEAALLGLIVTATHTGGVYPIGIVALYGSCYVSVFPERIYPWLGMASGLAIFGMGCFFFMQRYLERGPTYVVACCLSYGPSGGGIVQPYSAHRYYGIDCGCANPVKAGTDQNGVGKASPFREILAIGVAGGIVPCPAALFVLLTAIALHRVAYGLMLVLAFSIGLATVLIAVGLLAIYSRGFTMRLYGENALTMRWLPLTSAAIMALTGLMIATDVLTTAGISNM